MTGEATTGNRPVVPSAEPTDVETPRRVITAGPVRRLLWVAAGLVAVGLGFLGMFLPVLPSTGFFILAAWAFSKSSPRLERWVLGLPKVGPLVQDYRNGLGMSKKAKITAISMMWLAILVSSVLGLRSRPLFIALAVGLGLIGTAYIVWRVPLKERVLAERAARR